MNTRYGGWQFHPPLLQAHFETFNPRSFDLIIKWNQYMHLKNGNPGYKLRQNHNIKTGKPTYIVFNILQKNP
jgi:hypothetical protein